MDEPLGIYTQLAAYPAEGQLHRAPRYGQCCPMRASPVPFVKIAP